MTVPTDASNLGSHPNLKTQAQGQKLANSRSPESPTIEDIVADTCYGVMDDLRNLVRDMHPRNAKPLSRRAAANQLRQLISQLGKEAEALDAEADARVSAVREVNSE